MLQAVWESVGLVAQPKKVNYYFKQSSVHRLIEKTGQVYASIYKDYPGQNLN